MSTFSSSGRHAPVHKSIHGHTAPPRSPQRRAAREEAAPRSGPTAILMAALFSLPVTAGIGLILLLATTAIAASTPDPDAMISPLSIGVLGVTALLGGLVSARRCGRDPLLCGLCGGIMFTLLLWVLTLFVDRTDPALTLGVAGWGRWAMHAAVVILELAGGLMGGYTPKRKRTHSKRR